MGTCKVVNGLNANTTQHLVFDAGAFFKDYDIAADTYDTAVAAGKLLGATKGGGSFKAVPIFRVIELDGLRGATKGTKILDSWDIAMSANVAEVTPDTLASSLAVTNDVEEATTPKGYKKITGKMCVSDSDYIGNITWVGTVSGSDDPVIVQIYNALNEKGLELSFEDKGEAVVELEFAAHLDMAVKEVPFAVYYPTITPEV